MRWDPSHLQVPQTNTSPCLALPPSSSLTLTLILGTLLLLPSPLYSPGAISLFPLGGHFPQKEKILPCC